LSDISKINIDKKEYFFKDAAGRARAEEAATEAKNAAKEYADAQIKALKGAVSADFSTLEKIEDKIEELDLSVDERFVNLNESLDTSFDGVDEQIGSTNAKVLQVETTANNALVLAQSKNLNKVFETTSAMYTWLANAANKSQLQVGSSLYIKEADVPDWWVTEVLDAPNADGRYYNIAPLEAEGAGGAAGPIEEFEGELTVDGWVGNEAPYTQTVVVDELSDYNNCAITLSSSATEEQMYAAALAEINDISYNENNNTITFVANGEKPTVVIPFTVCAGQSMNVVEMPNYLGQEIPTNHASATTTYGTGSSEKYGHVKVSDNYKTSDGAASAGVAASSKAVADVYTEINNDLTFKIKTSNTGVEVRYDKNWVNIRFVLQQYTITASNDAPSNDNTSVTLPDGIHVNYDLWTNGIFMSRYWRPLAHTVNVFFAANGNYIHLSTAQSTDQYVLAYDHTFPRSAFTIVD
jgi:hypothetical protein